jgi:hypothetical protein
MVGQIGIDALHDILDKVTLSVTKDKVSWTLETKGVYLVS